MVLICVYLAIGWAFIQTTNPATLQREKKNATTLLNVDGYERHADAAKCTVARGLTLLLLPVYVMRYMYVAAQLDVY